jgi:hypothetical protein
VILIKIVKIVGNPVAYGASLPHYSTCIVGRFTDKSGGELQEGMATLIEVGRTGSSGELCRQSLFQNSSNPV